jgi:hypothetical protein
MLSVVCCLYSARLVKETHPRLTTAVLKLDSVKQTGIGETMGAGYFFGPTAAFWVWRAWLVFGLGAPGCEGQAGKGMGGPSREEPGDGPRECFSPNPAQRIESRGSHESHVSTLRGRTRGRPERFVSGPTAWSSETWPKRCLKHGRGHGHPRRRHAAGPGRKLWLVTGKRARCRLMLQPCVGGQ